MCAASGDGVELTVQGADKRDAGRGVARLPESARKRLRVLSGDPVVIEGAQSTVAKVWPMDGSDDVVRIDADTRRNAGVNIGETVTVRTTSVKDANIVSVRPTESLPRGDDIEDVVRQKLLDRPIREGERINVEGMGVFVVSLADPEGPVRVTESTDLTVQEGIDLDLGDSSIDLDDASGAGGAAGGGTGDGQDGIDQTVNTGETGQTSITYEDIGGLDDELDLVREMIELPLSEPELFARVGVEPPRGVLLYGPPGTGKTLIARAVANEVDASFFTVSGPEIVSKYKGESEERLRETFAEARASAPSVIFFDEIDSIAGERDDEADVENRVVGQLLSLMDGLDERGDVVVIGATNRVDSLDPALRRGGRFDREIEIGAPNEGGRREILAVHTRGVPLGDDVDLDAVAARTHGFVGADLESLVKEAGMTALRRARAEGTAVDAIHVERADVERALASVEPSAMREYVAEQPTEGFEAVGGLDDAKAALARAVQWPLTYAPLFEAANATPPTGLLLHGPPGTGKTLLARAAAAEAGVNLVTVAGPELLDRYVGESERAVREVFERARQAAPSVVLLDEVDAVARSRGTGESEVGERVVSQLLTELDRAADNPSLAVVATTNRRDALDLALLRPGRLETHVEVPAPDRAARRAIFAVHAADKPLGDDVDLGELARATAGYSGADIAAVVREAAMAAIAAVTERYDGATANDHGDEVVLTGARFDTALRNVGPSLAE
jgi:transitional endoplasmic reticulum ATPase